MKSLLSPEELKEEVVLKKKGQIAILVLNRYSNTFHTDFVRKINAKLDEVENSDSTTCLVTVSTDPKIFSNGLDLQHVMGMTKPEVHNYLLEVIRMFGRFTAFPVPTLAILNGHAFAGGCMLALSHDYRIMNSKRGFMCMNEVELGFPLPPGMNAVCQQKVTPQVARDLILTAKRYDGPNALKSGLVDEIEEPEKLLEKGMKMAEGLTKFGSDKKNFKKLKEELYKGILDACYNKGLSVGIRAEDGPALTPKL